MEDYNFWADLLASYRASPDLVKVLWLLSPLALALGFAALAIGTALRLTEPRGSTSRSVMLAKEERLKRVDLSESQQPPLIPLPGPSPRKRGEGGSSDADDFLSPFTGKG